jgi:lysozyme
MSDPLVTATTTTDPESAVTVYSARNGKSWQVSDDAMRFIAVLESGLINGKNYLGHHVTDGFILSVYLDNRGFPTVGCGHLVLATDKLKEGDVITLERAREFLKSDLARVEKRLNRDVRVPLYQFEYDALASIIFNCGHNDGADKIIDKTNTGEYDKLFDYILPYRIGKNHNLKRRRFCEARLFAAGVYDARH